MAIYCVHCLLEATELIEALTVTGGEAVCVTHWTDRFDTDDREAMADELREAVRSGTSQNAAGGPLGPPEERLTR